MTSPANPKAPPFAGVVQKTLPTSAGHRLLGAIIFQIPQKFNHKFNSKSVPSPRSVDKS